MRIEEYLTAEGKSPFEFWFLSLDARAAAKVTTALTRLGAGNRSNVKSLGSGTPLGWRSQKTSAIRHRCCQRTLARLQTTKKNGREIEMPLTKKFKDTVMARAKADKGFREELIVEATNALLEGDIEVGKSLIRDYLNATEAFSVIAEQLHKDEKSIRRMLGPSGNPTLKNFIGILKICGNSERLNLKICHH